MNLVAWNTENHKMGVNLACQNYKQNLMVFLPNGNQIIIKIYKNDNSNLTNKITYIDFFYNSNFLLIAILSEKV